jgi:hypothetical protein
MSAMCQARIRSCTGEKYPCRNRATRVKCIYSPMLVCGLHYRSDPSGGWGERPAWNEIPRALIPKYIAGLRSYGDELLDDRENIQRRLNENRALVKQLESIGDTPAARP